MTLYCATGNAGKLREFRGAARPGWEIEPLPDLASLAAPEETGTTFEQNAILKARYYADFSAGCAIFAEDSGLEVDALGGAPGVYSSRFSGENATDSSNNALLLEKLQGAGNRSARYVAVIALILHGQPPRTFRGTVEGQILEAPQGSGGFGYDPLFWYPAFGRTFAEVSREEKLGVSHRGRATAAMMEFLGEGRG